MAPKPEWVSGPDRAADDGHEIGETLDPLSKARALNGANRKSLCFRRREVFYGERHLVEVVLAQRYFLRIFII